MNHLLNVISFNHFQKLRVNEFNCKSFVDLAINCKFYRCFQYLLDVNCDNPFMIDCLKNKFGLNIAKDNLTFEDISKILPSTESEENVKKNLFKFWIDFKLSDRESILNFFKPSPNSGAEIADPYHQLLFKIVKNNISKEELEEKIKSYKERIKTDDLFDDEVQSILLSEISIILKLAYELEHYDIIQNILQLGNSLCGKQEEGDKLFKELNVEKLFEFKLISYERKRSLEH